MVVAILLLHDHFNGSTQGVPQSRVEVLLDDGGTEESFIHFYVRLNQVVILRVCRIVSV